MFLAGPRTPFGGQYLGSTKTIIRQAFRSRPPYNSSRSLRATADPNKKMENRPEEQQQRGQETDNIALVISNPSVNKLQELIQSGGWEKCWAQGVTPWDLGKPTPILVHLHQTGCIPKGRALVPGCGSGYDVISIACPERYVVGADISELAIQKAIEFSSSLPNADYVSFLKEDFFNWHPDELFDLIFDYTFFCAIEPDMRSAWASQMQNLLKPDGELLTLMFPIDDHDGGPPYKVSVADYEEVLHPMGFEAVSIVDDELAVEPRKGREKLGRWKKLGRSLL